jgi:hypothetical protein
MKDANASNIDCVGAVPASTFGEVYHQWLTDWQASANPFTL